MDQFAIMRVSAVVVAAMYLLRWSGLSQRWALVLAPLVSGMGVGLWAYTNPPVDRPEVFSYVAGWIAVTMSAATVWGFCWAAPRR